MKSMVAEMVALVNGSGNGARSGLSQRIEAQKKAGQKALAMATAALETSKNEPPAVHLQKEVDPEQVIPVDDAEFKGF